MLVHAALVPAVLLACASACRSPGEMGSAVVTMGALPTGQVDPGGAAGLRTEYEAGGPEAWTWHFALTGYDNGREESSDGRYFPQRLVEGGIGARRWWELGPLLVSLGAEVGLGYTLDTYPEEDSDRYGFVLYGQAGPRLRLPVVRGLFLDLELAWMVTHLSAWEDVSAREVDQALTGLFVVFGAGYSW